MPTQRNKTNMTALQLVKNCKGLASLPTIYQQLDEAINAESVSNFKISQIINSDPALASKLLQITNSAKYNFPTKVETISHAVAIIGTRELRKLALATSVISLTGNLPENNIDYPGFWHHCICCAINARIVASFRREVNIEQYYVAGLLHDIGRLVLMLEIPDLYKTIIDKSSSEQVWLQVVEKETLGFDHSEVGYELLKQWGLPEYLQLAALYHHEPGKAEKHQDIATVIHFSDMIAAKTESSSSLGSKHLIVDESHLEKLGFTSKVFESVTHKMEEQLNEMLKIFSFN
jgi:putative nucleotidyltransferase with HDIG domain